MPRLRGIGLPSGRARLAGLHWLPRAYQPQGTRLRESRARASATAQPRDNGPSGDTTHLDCSEQAPGRDPGLRELLARCRAPFYRVVQPRRIGRAVCRARPDCLDSPPGEDPTGQMIRLAVGQWRRASPPRESFFPDRLYQLQPSMRPRRTAAQRRRGRRLERRTRKVERQPGSASGQYPAHATTRKTARPSGHRLMEKRDSNTRSGATVPHEMAEGDG